MDCIWLIFSDDYGNPAPGSGLGHWVRVTDNPNLTIGNQLTDGAQFPHSDCGEECVASDLNDRGKGVSVITIEHEANAGPAGTNATQLVQALADNGVSAHVVSGDPPTGYVGNPLGGRVLSPASYPVYLAASQHEYVSIDTPGGSDVPLSIDLKNGLSVLTSIVTLGEENPDDAARAGQIGDNGENFIGVVQGLMGSAEAQAWQAERARIKNGVLDQLQAAVNGVAPAISLAQQFPTFQAQLNQQLTNINNAVAALPAASSDTKTVVQEAVTAIGAALQGIKL